MSFGCDLGEEACGMQAAARAAATSIAADRLGIFGPARCPGRRVVDITKWGGDYTARKSISNIKA
jgi:hypothetical protein